MAGVVLDASAIIALLRREPGFERVSAVAATAQVSTVNLAEVGSFLTMAGQSPPQVRVILASLRLDQVPFDTALALEVARLRPLTRHLGLSLGDRACLALAGLRRLPALTADRLWADLDLGIEIQLIR